MNKEKLQQDIDRMKAKLAEMEAELEKNDKFEWEYPDKNTFILYESTVRSGFYGDSPISLECGTYRLSKQYAEHSLERNRVANRLEALVEQFEPDYLVPVIGEYVAYVYIGEECEYRWYKTSTHRVIGQVYMSKETAIKICEMLNSGEVVL